MGSKKGGLIIINPKINTILCWLFLGVIFSIIFFIFELRFIYPLFYVWEELPAMDAGNTVQVDDQYI